jgi:hypothetical protein
VFDLYAPVSSLGAADAIELRPGNLTGATSSKLTGIARLCRAAA